LLEIRLLGNYEVRQDGQIVDIQSRPARLLLAYLLLPAGKRQPREKLAGILWPESDENNARSNLRQALWRLRKGIGDEYVLADNYSVFFDTSAPYWLDIAALESGSDHDLPDALSAYRGELLPGYYEDWIFLERERLAATFERKMQQWLNRLAGQGAWTAVIEWAEQWIAFGAIPEPAYRALMEAHAAQGDLARMAAAYDRCVAALHSEIGVEPSAETRVLYDRLSRETTPVEPIVRPAKIREVPDAPAHNLPFQSTPCIGRERELAEVSRLLSEGRLVTIVGLGGMGKTRLALEAAKNLVGDFRNGVYLVRLAPISSAELIVQTIAEALGFPLATQEDPKRQLLRHLKTRQYLLLFDNFEQLLNGATLVSEILETAGEVKILITSREKLNLQEESILQIEGLAVPDSPSPEEALNFSAIRLFHDSARRQKSSFAIRSPELPHIIHICRLVNGMPLGILLATAWVAALTIEEIAAEISRSLDFLQADWRDVPDRHRSLRAVFESTWKRFTESQRLLLARLTIFRGGFTRVAAEAVGGASMAELVDLVNKSLLQRDAETGRFDIHELLGQFSRAYLEATPEEWEALSNAHAIYYADFMDRIKPHMFDSRNVEALAAIEADLQNVRLAWRYWLDRKAASRIRMFANTFWRVYDIRGWYNAGDRLYQSAIDALQPGLVAGEDDEKEAVYAELLGCLSLFKAQLGANEQGLILAQECVAILKRINRISDLAIHLDHLQFNALYVEDPIASMDLEREIRDYIIDHGDDWIRAYHLCWRGRAIAWHGDHERGLAQVEESLKLFESLGDLFAAVWPGLELGHLAVQRSDFESAKRCYRRVLENSQKASYDWAVAKAVRYLGDIAAIEGDFQNARSYLTWGLRLAEALGLTRDEVSLLYDLATVKAASGSPEEAVKLLATIQEHPFSRQTRTFSVFLGEKSVRFHDLAEELLANLKDKLTPERFATALTDGRTFGFDQTVIDILAAA